ncbi:hypothetical protein T484DRAFT_2712081 [Baffinella frigidus]|nr:hypothetical protein T484DRAFT_2712081 [Cryptophyta sp. CCMP2293]|eukprot:CAMPEP_0180160228 /NCGR_PEP_ID=MMETSP0986-20121125/27983_1 /TAXON_ID=697907 /ORGANISM="non described non described, Strain CCMP2293" /LENGTH=300 /DNA_ID=CAMNT_0022110441 /DNA_START=37 /DNA_END=939 /DNA_ORIENTATION=+
MHSPQILAAACLLAMAAPGSCFLPVAQPRMLQRGGAAGAHMAIQSGKVVVYGAFDRTGTCLLRTMEKGPFKALVEVSPEFDNSIAKIKYPIDGQGSKSLPPSATFVSELPSVDGCVVASEIPVAGDQMTVLIKSLVGIKKIVYLSRVGVERRDEFMRKINPFNKLEEWYAAEEATKAAAEAAGIECTIVRTGDLIGGPFYDTTGDLQMALEGVLFDSDNKCMQVSYSDTLDGKTSRDLTATALMQALMVDAPLVHVVSKKETPLTCSVTNHMGIPATVARERRVFTPTADEWAAAFSQAK